MSQCGICKQSLNGKGSQHLLRTKDGRLRLGDLCAGCADLQEGHVGTTALLRATLGFSCVALVCGCVSYLLLTFFVQQPGRSPFASRGAAKYNPGLVLPSTQENTP